MLALQKAIQLEMAKFKQLVNPELIQQESLETRIGATS